MQAWLYPGTLAQAFAVGPDSTIYLGAVAASTSGIPVGAGALVWNQVLLIATTVSTVPVPRVSVSAQAPMVAAGTETLTMGPGTLEYVA